MKYDEWLQYQDLNNEMDICDTCNTFDLIDMTAPNPARPFLRPKSKPILFIAESTRAGGFWQFGNQDFVRRHLIPIVLNPTEAALLDLDSEKALHSFVAAGFYFVQAVKRPFRKGSSYSDLGKHAAYSLLQHAVGSHLRRELALLRPSAIICLGTAAWDACLFLRNAPLKALKPRDLEKVRLHHHTLPLFDNPVPSHLTYLPVERSKPRTQVMRADVPVFLNCVRFGMLCEGVGNRASTRSSYYLP